MAKHTDWTKAELLAKAGELGLSPSPGATKTALIDSVDRAEQARAIATGVPAGAADFGDLPDEVEPAPEPESLTSLPSPDDEPEPRNAIPPPPNAGQLPPPATRWRLVRDLTMIRGGVPVTLKAGRLLLSSQYDLGAIRLAGGELEAVPEG